MKTKGSESLAEEYWSKDYQESTRSKLEEDRVLTGRARVRSTHIVLPAFNEEKSLPPLLKRLSGINKTYEGEMFAWVVDDGSSDNTAEIASKGEPGLAVNLVPHKRNLGLGQAVMSGIMAALHKASDSDVIVVMDADDTHDVGVIDSMIDLINAGGDIAVASRFTPGGDDRTAPLFRRMLSRGAALVFKTILPVEEIEDFTSGYRAYRAALLRRAVRHWGERLIEEQGFACMVELLLKLRYLHPVIFETPLVLRYDRKQGKSKLKLAKTMIQYFKLAVRDRLSPEPLRDI
jgi:dolichol-phosphate mannosyltransferase